MIKQLMFVLGVFYLIFLALAEGAGLKLGEVVDVKSMTPIQ